MNVSSFRREFDEAVEETLTGFGRDGEKGVETVGGGSEGRDAFGIYRDGARGLAGEIFGAFNGIENRGEIPGRAVVWHREIELVGLNDRVRSVIAEIGLD